MKTLLRLILLTSLAIPMNSSEQMRTLDLSKALGIQTREGILLLSPVPDKAKCILKQNKSGEDYFDCGEIKFKTYILPQYEGSDKSEEEAPPELGTARL